MKNQNPIQKSNLKPWQTKMHEVIFEADTKAGKLFDILLLIAILLSVGLVMMESVPSVNAKYGTELRIAEWIFTIFFTIEYVCRLLSIGKPIYYVFSFYGIVDLLSILPTYLGLFFTSYHSLTVIRSLRLLRVFRVFKLGRYIGEGRIIIDALKASRPKIIVFLVAVLSLCLIMGTLMYLIEDADAGFTSIPRSIYWAIVTLTTVGYGDISPVTPLGQALASFIMIMGYAIIAVPTGIVTNELNKMDASNHNNTQSCPNCATEGHDDDAVHCKKCGAHL